MLLPITLATAALVGLGNLALAARVSQARMAGGVLLGDGGNPQLIARVRSHANLSEYAPLVLILMGLIEAAGSPRWALAAIAAVFVIGRIAHAIGMEKGTANPWRAGGAVTTWAVLLGLAGWGLVLAAAAERHPALLTAIIDAPRQQGLHES